jgi:hypothetical protein
VDEPTDAVRLSARAIAQPGAPGGRPHDDCGDLPLHVPQTPTDLPEDERSRLDILKHQPPMLLFLDKAPIRGASLSRSVLSLSES